MKRFLSFLLVAVLLLSSCGRTLNNKEETLAEFTDALKVYDRDAMSALLTEFPDKSQYVYLDDIFNDAKYIELYRLLYSDIDYKVKSSSKNQIVAEFTMPDIKSLYTGVVAIVMNIAISDQTLVDKLDENEENGIILTQEMMLTLAKQGKAASMTKEYTLTFTEKDGKTVIACDDELRALMTGDFFLSKNTTLEEVNNSTD